MAHQALPHNGRSHSSRFSAPTMPARTTAAIPTCETISSGSRVKPARALKVGDELSIQRGNDHFVVIVLALSERRGSASVART